MNELRLCRNTWMRCDGNCSKCDVVATDATYIVKPIFNTTPITEEPLKMPPVDGSTTPKELLKTDNIQIFVNEGSINRKQAIKKVKAYKISAPTDGVEKVINAVIDAIARSIAELPAANTPQHTECVVNEDE